MELNDEVVINAPRDQVYAALNDPEILKYLYYLCLISQNHRVFQSKLYLFYQLPVKGLPYLREQVKASISPHHTEEVRSDFPHITYNCYPEWRTSSVDRHYNHPVQNF